MSDRVSGSAISSHPTPSPSYLYPGQIICFFRETSWGKTRVSEGCKLLGPSIWIPPLLFRWHVQVFTPSVSISPLLMTPSAGTSLQTLWCPVKQNDVLCLWLMFLLLKQNQKNLCVIWDTSGFLSSPRRRYLGDWSGRWGCSVIPWSGGFYLVLHHCWSCLLSFSLFFSCWLEADPTVISTTPSCQHLRVSKPLTSVCRFPSPQIL